MLARSLAVELRKFDPSSYLRRSILQARHHHNHWGSSLANANGPHTFAPKTASLSNPTFLSPRSDRITDGNITCPAFRDFIRDRSAAHRLECPNGFQNTVAFPVPRLTVSTPGLLQAVSRTRRCSQDGVPPSQNAKPSAPRRVAVVRYPIAGIVGPFQLK